MNKDEFKKCFHDIFSEWNEVLPELVETWNEFCIHKCLNDKMIYENNDLGIMKFFTDHGIDDFIDMKKSFKCNGRYIFGNENDIKSFDSIDKSNIDIDVLGEWIFEILPKKWIYTKLLIVVRKLMDIFPYVFCAYDTDENELLNRLEFEKRFNEYKEKGFHNAKKSKDLNEFENNLSFYCISAFNLKLISKSIA